MGEYRDRRTGESIYLVDGEGSGCFGIIVAIVTPFFLLAMIINGFAVWVSQHSVMVILIYTILNFLVSAILAKAFRSYGAVNYILEVAANFILLIIPLNCFMSYLVPLEVVRNDFDTFFEVIVVVGLNIAGIILASSLRKFLPYPIIHLVLSIILWVFFYMLMRSVLQGSDIWELGEIYNIENSTLLHLLYGIYYL